jgi:hypothetical protein
LDKRIGSQIYNSQIKPPGHNYNRLPCDCCRAPTRVFIWRYWLHLCPDCLEVCRAGLVWERKTKKVG